MKRERVDLTWWLGHAVPKIRVPFDLVGQCLWHQAMENEPWDMIAWRYWKNEEKWYLIADVNGVSDPFVFPSSGERIAVPGMR